MSKAFFQLSCLQFSQHPTKRAPDAGDSAHIPSSFHALAFFWLDGFAVPAPAQVTQSVGLPLANFSQRTCMFWLSSPFTLIAFLFTVAFVLIYISLAIFQGRKSVDTIIANRIALFSFAVFAYLVIRQSVPEFWIEIFWSILFFILLVFLLIIFFLFINSRQSLVSDNKLLDLGFKASNIYYLLSGLLLMYSAGSSVYDGFTGSEFPWSRILGIVISSLGGLLSIYLSSNKTVFTEQGIFSDFGFIQWANIVSYEWKENKRLLLTTKSKNLLQLFRNKVGIDIPEKFRSAVQDLLSQKL